MFQKLICTSVYHEAVRLNQSHLDAINLFQFSILPLLFSLLNFLPHGSTAVQKALAQTVSLHSCHLASLLLRDHLVSTLALIAITCTVSLSKVTGIWLKGFN